MKTGPHFRVPYRSNPFGAWMFIKVMFRLYAGSKADIMNIKAILLEIFCKALYRYRCFIICVSNDSLQ
ncbi:hypothetical protein bpr_II190 (plasmid) [Butyrivibrio proteoclasticus B316]|uniref:Uncharacterized protein n=1 Tax=Butyrivibrio proteoclasticus (strain ATCC 51982 / DSM 14932 / B316) TaxID=515622 RepID=E0S3Z6_BUTPB|nr:hypothetical protein bpr_II190 [Butyrivibrio proteoclasticus B316]